jgi:hypothetical protein
VDVISVGEDGSLSAAHAIDSARKTDAKTLHGFGEALSIDGLDDQVDVISLHGELLQAHAEAIAGMEEGALNAPKTLISS